jgi:hypothetical protein
VIAEAAATLGDQDARVTAFGHFRDRVPDVVWREELAFLDVDHASGSGRRNQQIGLPAEECRNLQNVGDVGRRLRVGWFVNVGDDRHAERRLDPRQHAKSLVEARSAERADRGAVRFVVRRLEDVRETGASRDVGHAPRDVVSVLLAFDHTRAGDQRQRRAAADRDRAGLNGSH